MRARVRVEIEWLLALAGEPGIVELQPFSDLAADRLRARDGPAGARTTTGFEAFRSCGAGDGIAGSSTRGGLAEALGAGSIGGGASAARSVSDAVGATACGRRRAATHVPAHKQATAAPTPSHTPARDRGGSLRAAARATGWTTVTE